MLLKVSTFFNVIIWCWRDESDDSVNPHNTFIHSVLTMATFGIKCQWLRGRYDHTDHFVSPEWPSSICLSLVCHSWHDGTGLTLKNPFENKNVQKMLSPSYPPRFYSLKSSFYMSIGILVFQFGCAISVHIFFTFILYMLPILWQRESKCSLSQLNNHTN